MNLAECHPNRKYYALGMCRPCYEADLKQRNPEFAERQAKNKAEWREAHPDRMKRYLQERKKRERQDPKALRVRASGELRRKYGITIEDYDILLQKQNNGCALCFRAPDNRRLHVDHCHTTNKVRGLLCHQCNWYLGTIDHDPTIIERIIKYRG